MSCVLEVCWVADHGTVYSPPPFWCWLLSHAACKALDPDVAHPVALQLPTGNALAATSALWRCFRRLHHCFHGNVRRALFLAVALLQRHGGGQLICCLDTRRAATAGRAGAEARERPAWHARGRFPVAPSCVCATRPPPGIPWKKWRTTSLHAVFHKQRVCDQRGDKQLDNAILAHADAHGTRAHRRQARRLGLVRLRLLTLGLNGLSAAPAAAAVHGWLEPTCPG